LARIEKALSTGSAATEGAMLTDYRDEALTAGKPYWGALRKVIERRRDETSIDPQWLVIVQEPLVRE
jgi:hypothetical protein